MRNVSEKDRATIEAEAEGIVHWSHDDSAALQNEGYVAFFTPNYVLLADVRNLRVDAAHILTDIQEQGSRYPFSKLQRLIIKRRLLNPMFKVLNWRDTDARGPYEG